MTETWRARSVAERVIFRITRVARCISHFAKIWSPKHVLRIKIFKHNVQRPSRVKVSIEVWRTTRICWWFIWVTKIYPTNLQKRICEQLYNTSSHSLLSALKHLHHSFQILFIFFKKIAKCELPIVTRRIAFSDFTWTLIKTTRVQLTLSIVFGHNFVLMLDN